MTKTEFKKLCYSFQEGEWSEGFNASGLIQALETEDIDFELLNSHEAVKEWFKWMIDEEYNCGHIISRWYKEGFADYYKVDMSMGTIARIIALATAEDFYDAFEDYFDNDEEEEDNV